MMEYFRKKNYVCVYLKFLPFVQGERLHCIKSWFTVWINESIGLSAEKQAECRGFILLINPRSPVELNKLLKKIRS